MTRSGKRRGFTLLELLTVMAIMGIIMASGAAAFFGLGKGSRMRGAVNNLRSAIALARQQAVLKGQPLILRFEHATVSDQDYYFVTNAVEHYAVGEKRFVPNGVEIESPGVPFEITFEPRGGTAGGASPTIRIQDQAGTERWELTIYGLTGLVRVEEL